jgi:hypothetical protein
MKRPYIRGISCSAKIFDEMKKRHKVGRHQLRGETGSAAEGQPANMQEAIDRATADWPLLSMFDASFGSLQRLREDTYAESTSPAKLPAANVQEPDAPSTHSASAAAAKRLRASRSSSPVCILPKPGDDLQRALNHRCLEPDYRELPRGKKHSKSRKISWHKIARLPAT